MNARRTRIAGICVSLIVVAVFTASSYAIIDMGSIVGAWLFNEGQGNTAKDSSGKGKDGNIKGGAKWVDGNSAKR